MANTKYEALNGVSNVKHNHDGQSGKIASSSVSRNSHLEQNNSSKNNHKNPMTTKNFESNNERQVVEEHGNVGEMYSIDNYNNNSYYFLSRKAVINLPKFVYKGEDRSLLYKYVLSPLAEFCVNNLTPRSVAPNTITLSGLILMVITYFVVWYYVPDLYTNSTNSSSNNSSNENDNNDHRWIYALNGLSMLIYQTLDNMDGKQARRTKSSSPMGLLFDHGCDALNSMIGSANWIVSMGPLLIHNDPMSIWFLIVGPMAMFYIATWEEYYTGALIMPIINGPSEGVLGGALLSLTSALYGPQFWLQTSWYDTLMATSSNILPSSVVSALLKIINTDSLRNCDFVIISAAIGISQEVILKSIYVSRKYGMKTLLNILPMATIVLSTLLIGYYDFDIFVRMPRTTLHLLYGLFCEAVTQLMLDHISHETYYPFRRYLFWPLIALTFVIVMSKLISSSNNNSSNDYDSSSLYYYSIDEILMIYTTIVWTCLLTKMTLVIHEISSALNIWCFDIITPRRKNLSEVALLSSQTQPSSYAYSSTESIEMITTTSSDFSSSNSSSRCSSSNSMVSTTESPQKERGKRKVI